MKHTPRAMLAAALGEAEQEYRAAQLAMKLRADGASDRLALATERLRHLHRATMMRGDEATGEITLPPDLHGLKLDRN
jgi:hypothetical protein